MKNGEILPHWWIFIHEHLDGLLIVRVNNDFSVTLYINVGSTTCS